MKRINKLKYFLLTLAPYITVLYLIPLCAIAADATSSGKTVGEILINIQKDFPDILSWLSGLCTVIGIAFILLAFFKLKHLADFRTMSGGQQDVGKAFILLALGAIFLWMPFMLNIMTYSLFGNSITGLREKYAITGDSNYEYKRAFFQMMMIIGLISFIRGWLILSSMAKGQSQPGTIGKAITHIVAGLFLYHLLAVIRIFEASVGQTFVK